MRSRFEPYSEHGCGGQGGEDRWTPATFPAGHEGEDGQSEESRRDFPRLKTSEPGAGDTRSEGGQRQEQRVTHETVRKLVDSASGRSQRP